MNRILLSSAALLVATASFAQNTATVNQNGTNQTATANQSGNTLTSTISQVGTTATNQNNQGLSFQTGNGHVSTINQNNGSLFNRAGVTQDNAVSGVGSNSATISQSNGSGGTGLRGGDPATAAGNGNWTGILQKGSGNRATLTQDGANTTKNFAEAYQYGTNNGVGSTGPVSVSQNGATDGRAEIRQGTSSIAVTNNGATVDQSGSTRNDAFVNQLTNNNKATVLQTGNQSNDNTASIQQGTAANMTGGGNEAIIRQETNTPEPPSTGTTSSNSTFNQAYILQLGTNSLADIKQRKDADRNYAEINQFSGDASKAYVQQEFQSTSQNRAVINQYGDRQNAYSSQIKADRNELLINQGAPGVSSSDNQAYSYQSFSNLGRVTIAQNTTATGGSNFAKVAQGYYVADPARTVGNVASIQQDGSNNRTNLVQTGTAMGAGNNMATIGQYGNGNVVGGTARTPNPSQPDTFESALQDGGMNSMTVLQNSTGSGNSSINTASLSQTGMSNTLNLTQTAVTVSNTSTVTQTGMMNQTIVQQNGVAN